MLISAPANTTDGATMAITMASYKPIKFFGNIKMTNNNMYIG